jgi:hypothetical protein
MAVSFILFASVSFVVVPSLPLYKDSHENMTHRQLNFAVIQEKVLCDSPTTTQQCIYVFIIINQNLNREKTSKSL